MSTVATTPTLITEEEARSITELLDDHLREALELIQRVEYKVDTSDGGPNTRDDAVIQDPAAAMRLLVAMDNVELDVWAITKELESVKKGVLEHFAVVLSPHGG